MLDILLSRLREEIAIDGEKGTNIECIWAYIGNIIRELTKSACQNEPTIDDKYKSFLWPHLRAIDSVGFYRADSPNTNSPVKTTAQTKQKSRKKPKKSQADTDSNVDMDNLSEEEDEKLKENIAGYTRVDVKNLSYQQFIKDYGENIYAIASKELQEKQLYKNVPPVVIASAKQLQALQAILRQRSTGLYQYDLTRLLDIDQKAAGHYAKSLEEKSAIFRVPVALKGIHTNLCIHVQFRNQHESTYNKTSEQRPYNLNEKGEFITSEKIFETIVDVTKYGSSNLVIARDILYALGFESSSDAVKLWFNRCIADLAIKGYIKKGYTQVDNKGHYVRCIEVLESSFNNAAKETQNLTDVSYPITVDGSTSNESGTYIDTNLMQQIFNIIEKSSINGAGNKEFSLALNSDAQRLIFKILERLIDTSSEVYPSLFIKRHYEFQGRRRQFRYFTLQNYNTLVEKKDTDIVPFPEIEWDETKLNEIDLLKPVIRTRRHFLESHRDYISPYYSNLIATRKSKRPIDDSTQSDDLSNEETNNNGATRRPKKRTKSQDPKKSENEVQPTRTTRTTRSTRKNLEKDKSTQLNVSVSEKKAAKSNNNAPKKSKISSPDDEELNSVNPTLNKVPKTTRKTRSQSKTEVASGKESASSNSKRLETEDDITSRNDISIDADDSRIHSETPISLRAPTEDHTTSEVTNLSETHTKETKAIKQNKRQVKKIGSRQVAEQKSTTPKRTLVDYFGAATKKQKITKDNTNATSSSLSSPTGTNTIIPEGDQDIVSPDQTMSAMETMNDPVRGVEVDPTEMEVVESADILAGPSPVATSSQLTQQSNIQVSEAIPAIGPPNSVNLTANTTTTTTTTTSDSTVTPNHRNSSAVINTTSTPISQPSTTTITPSQKRGNVNSYSEIRKRVLLDVLEKEEVVEVSKGMRAKFEEAHERIVGKKLTGTVCLKTLWKTCLELGKSGDAHAKVIDCTMLNGKKVTRKVLVRKDVDLDGAKFKEKIERIKTTRAVMKPINSLTQFEKYDAPVERLQDRLNRMKEEILEKTDISQPEALKRVAKLSEYENNASNSVTGQIFFKHGRDTEPRRSFWMITSISHGWLYGRMLRVKSLFNYIFDLLNRPVCIQGVDKEKRTLSLHSIVYNLPCSIFIQVICIMHWSDELKAYVDDPENTNKTYEDFPPSIREQLFSYSNKFARTIRKLISVLVFIGLLIPHGMDADQSQECVFSEFYEVPTSVELWDFRLKPEFALKVTYDIVTEKDVLAYWKTLQYYGLHDLPDEKNKVATWDSAWKKETVKSLFNTRNWDNITIFSKEQRNQLSSYVNNYKNYTPAGNLGLCRKIALETGCTVNSVRAYYTKIQDMMNAKMAERTQRRVLRESKGDTIVMRKRNPNTKRSGSSRIINQQTKHIFGSKEQRVLHPNTLLDKDSKNNEMDKPSYLDSMDSVLTLDNHENVRFTRSKRCQWTKQKDDLLMYSYVVIQHRSDKARFLWHPIKQVIPEATGGACRHRMAKLLMNPFNQEYMSKCKELWKTAYAEGLSSGEFKDVDPTDAMDFDLISQLEYLIKRIEVDIHKDQEISPLPASLTLLHDNYNVTNSSFHGNPFYEAVHHKKSSLISKMQTMYSQCYSIRTVLGEVLDYPISDMVHEDDLNMRNVKLIMMLSMMILMTPQECYDPYVAFRLLGGFDDALVAKAFADLRNVGWTAITKVSRVIPGTRYSISSKFIKKMADIYPKNMVEQSAEYEKYLSQAGRNQINPSTLSSGMMACLTDLLSNNKIHITMTSFDRQINRLEFENSARLIDRNLIKYDLFVKADVHMNQTQSKEIMTEPYIYPLDVGIFDKVLSTVLLSSPENQRQPIKNIVAYMNNRGSLGSVASDLRDHFISYREDEIQSCLDILLQANPPLMCLVGINFERYVLTISKYIDSWTLLRDISTISKDTETPLFQNLVAIRPALWIDMNGDTTSVVFKDCCRTIIGWIINKPGITLASLHRFLCNFMNRVELNRVLKWLIEQNAIKPVSVCQNSNGKVGLFSKTRLSRATKSPQFKRNVETSYWVVPGYYNCILV